MSEAKFSDLVGQALSAIEVRDDEIVFAVEKGAHYRMYHPQDCCESVTVESIVGDLLDLIGEPILLAEESTSNENPANADPEKTEYQDSFTWTFYKLATRKGYVDIRWYGDSNGYYSESVYFDKVR